MKFLLALSLSMFLVCANAQTVLSPDKNITVSVNAGNTLTISAQYKETQIIAASEIGMSVAGIKPNWKPISTATRQNDNMIISPVPEKRKAIRDHYSELTIHFKSKLGLQVRVYNDGFAYRFTSLLKDTITIQEERTVYSIPDNVVVYASPVQKKTDADIFHTSFEEPYLRSATDTLSDKYLFFTPLLLAYANGIKVVLTESDLEDYPGMFLTFAEKNKLHGRNAPYPLDVRMTDGGFPQEVVVRRADYIARTAGTRTYPWRVFMLSEYDKQLPDNDMVYRLASPSRVKDASWIKPGKGTDEWIIGINLFDIPFKAGVNTATYKYYIDFARRFGFERIMMDAGWSDYKDLFSINPDIDMDEISRYARQQGISLSMWTLASTLDRQLTPALKQFRKWGVDFIMTDFMDRDDQKMVNFYHLIAKACADEKIMVMFHGAFKPAGFNRTWPNAVTREGVLGSEYNIWSTKAHPDHDLLLPFIRMTAGPMDYEPGILDNATKKTFRPIEEKVMSMGTRMHQAAMFVVYESPIQLFSGNPSQGLREPEFMELIGSIPTTWDETIVLDGKVGEYIVTARKKGDAWFVGGMTNWSGREVKIDFSFLGDDVFETDLAFDGMNADRYPSDFTISKKILRSTDSLTITMANGGGFVLRLRKKSP